MYKNEISDYKYYEIRRLREKVIQYGSEQYQTFPWRTPEHKWHGLLAEVLLQRTRANNVVPVYKKLVQLYPAPEDLASSKLATIEKLLFPLGLKWRAKFVQSLASSLMRLQSTPENLAELLLLPGVGPYAANAFLAFHTEKRAILIDSNTARFICRFTGQKYHGEVRKEKWLIEFIERLTPRKNSKIFNLSFLDFSMLVCKPTKPDCLECPLHRYNCSYGN
jgi:A/G-specific adenine glycosylase